MMGEKYLLSSLELSSTSLCPLNLLGHTSRDSHRCSQRDNPCPLLVLSTLQPCRLCRRSWQVTLNWPSSPSSSASSKTSLPSKPNFWWMPWLKKTGKSKTKSRKMRESNNNTSRGSKGKSNRKSRCASQEMMLSLDVLINSVRSMFNSIKVLEMRSPI